MKVAILFHFNKHTESVSVNTTKISQHLKQKINDAIYFQDRVSISYDSFLSIKKHQLKKGFKNIERIIGINILENI